MNFDGTLKGWKNSLFIVIVFSFTESVLLVFLEFNRLILREFEFKGERVSYTTMSYTSYVSINVYHNYRLTCIDEVAEFIMDFKKLVQRNF